MSAIKTHVIDGGSAANISPGVLIPGSSLAEKKTALCIGTPHRSAMARIADAG
jgi:hypothetical protein